MRRRSSSGRGRSNPGRRPPTRSSWRAGASSRPIVSRSETRIGGGRRGPGGFPSPPASVLRIEEGHSPLQGSRGGQEDRGGNTGHWVALGRSAPTPEAWGTQARRRPTTTRSPRRPTTRGRTSARQRGRRRPLGERAEKLQGTRLRAVPGRVDHPGGARGSSCARARRGRRPPGPRTPGGGTRAREAEARASREAETRAAEAEADSERSRPFSYGWGAGPASWPTRTGSQARTLPGRPPGRSRVPRSTP